MRIISASQPLCMSITKTLSITEESARYEFEHGGFRYILEVPNHYIFDGASIPRFLWGLLGLTPHGVMNGPSLPHDFCYEYQGLFPYGSYLIYDKYKRTWAVCDVTMTKAVSDSLLRALCVHFKACGKLKAALVWSGVAAFGFSSWNSDDKSRKELLLKHTEDVHKS